MSNDKFFVVVNGEKKNSWAESIWKDIEEVGTLFLDNNTLKQNSLLWRMKRLHFSNKINTFIKLPFKSIWNRTLCIQKGDLDPKDRNIIIFQGNVKFSPSYLKKLKQLYNVKVVLYLYDTIEKMGIGTTKKDFDNYCRYYKVDQVYSFDHSDCQKYGLQYFDLYSTPKEISNDGYIEDGMFYVGSCRSKDRLDILHSIYEKYKDCLKCDFYIVGVKENDQKYPNEIHYNERLKYSEVLGKISRSKYILEITNQNQTGYTVRFKEAVCFNKRLITNNVFVTNSKYYDKNKIILYSDAEDLKIDIQHDLEKCEYNYSGDFSPLTLAKLISTSIS